MKTNSYEERLSNFKEEYEELKKSIHNFVNNEIDTANFEKNAISELMNMLEVKSKIKELERFIELSKVNKQKIDVGDKVKTPRGIGEVLFIDDSDTIFPYLVGIKGYSGHNGVTILTKQEIQKYVIDKGYEGQCWLFREKNLEPIKEE